MRAVDEYRVTPWGLYMARPTPGRAQFHYLESWLLPSLGLRASVFHFNPGHERDQDYYLDVGRYSPGPIPSGIPRTTIWIWSCAPARGWNWLTSTSCSPPSDTDCSLRRSANRPCDSAVDAVQGLARHGYDLHRWLSGNGLDLTWRAA